MPDAIFQCSTCRRQHRWKAEMAGRPARCHCGMVLQVPILPPAASEDLYEIAPESPPLSALPAPAMPVPRPVLAYADPAPAGSSLSGDYFPDRTKDLHLPLVLLIGGLVVECISAWWKASAAGAGTLQALSEVGIGTVGGTVLMLIALFIAAKFRQIDLGRFWTAVLKLSAISVAPSAVMVIFDAFFFRFIPFGGLFVLVIGFCLYFALLGAFFDLDQSDTWYCVCVIFLVEIVTYLSLWWFLGRWI